MNSLTDAIRQKRERIEVLRAELSQLEQELREAKAELMGRPHTAKGALAGKRRRNPIARRRPIKEGSSVDLAIQVLRAVGHPMHINELIAQIAKTKGVQVAKPTLVSNLSRYLHGGETFTRPAESTYGLKEFETAA